MNNREELAKWRQPRMDKGYSFTYNKGIVNGKNQNVSITCIEDNETFEFKESEDEHQKA